MEIKNVFEPQLNKQIKVRSFSKQEVEKIGIGELLEQQEKEGWSFFKSFRNKGEFETLFHHNYE